MREDMYKVIVERPRRGGGAAFKSAGRKFRNSEDAPAKVGIKRGHIARKSLNENLAPLKRFLFSQVNRPWDKVYSELSAGIDRRNTVQEHIYSHLEQFVAIHTHWNSDGVRKPNNGDCVYMMERKWFGNKNTLRDCHFELYVHPVNGLLLRNEFYVRWSVVSRLKRAQEKVLQLNVKKVLSSTLEYHFIEDQWFEITLKQCPAVSAVEQNIPWDVLHRRPSRSVWPNYFAEKKRQLSAKEVEQIQNPAKRWVFCLGYVQ